MAIVCTRFSKRTGNWPGWDYVCDTRAEAQNGMPEEAPYGSTVQVGVDGSVWRKFPAGWKELPREAVAATAAVLMCGGSFLQG